MGAVFSCFDENENENTVNQDYKDLDEWFEEYHQNMSKALNNSLPISSLEPHKTD